MAYSRIFVTLNQCCQDYAKDIRGCVGRCIIELRNGYGRFILQVQGLKSNQPYSVVVLSEDKFADIVSKLYVDGAGKGEIRCTYDQQKTGINVDDIRAVAVLAADKAPLIGFTRGEYNWQRVLMAEPTVQVAKADAQKAAVISIIEEIDDNIQDIKDIISTVDTEEYIFGREHIKPFGDDNITWVRANIKELSAIKDLWRYANNPYVVQSCCEFKHILLGRDNNGYWLGVPCKYDKAYTLEAKLQGFKKFKPLLNQTLAQNQFCYCLLKC